MVKSRSLQKVMFPVYKLDPTSTTASSAFADYSQVKFNRIESNGKNTESNHIRSSVCLFDRLEKEGP